MIMMGIATQRTEIHNLQLADLFNTIKAKLDSCSHDRESCSTPHEQYMTVVSCMSTCLR